MLILSRKKDESLIINNDMTIVIVEIRGDKVRVGVHAPPDVPVHRQEVYEAIKRQGGALLSPKPRGPGMLVLSRHRDESIIIGDNLITITIVDIRGDKVRLGIAAPNDMPVHRQEVYEAIKRENERAARLQPPAPSAD